MLFGKWGRNGQPSNTELQALPTIEDHEVQPLVNGHENGSADGPPSAAIAISKPSTDKITCLDGLRGIACLLVFNYHFLWPWTAHIMLGHGAFPPAAPEPYVGWLFMPIICLLHRGRPMVAIFFAISGYVLCRHVLKAIKERRLEAAYKSLASAVFRRAFRLYIPPAITMLAVAILAQAGAFRSEDDIFKGPDSKFINGTVTIGYARRPCQNNTIPLDTTTDMARYLHLRTPNYLLNVTGKSISEWAPLYHFCLNDTSRLFSPASLYALGNSTEQEWWRIAMGLKADDTKSDLKADLDGRVIEQYKRQEQPQSEHMPVKDEPVEEPVKEERPGKAEEPVKVDEPVKVEEPVKAEEPVKVEKPVNTEEPKKVEGPETKHGKPPSLPPPPPFIPLYDDWAWVQLGGSWEEHPIIHNRTSWAIGNYTRVMAEWASPFNFGHYHPRYDPHTFTIPMEFRGSIFIYVFLLGTAALRHKWRIGIGAGLAMYALHIGRWDMCIFMGGMLHSELDVRRASRFGHARTPSAVAREAGLWRALVTAKAFRWACTLFALYLLSYPDAAADFTPGFMLLSRWVPKYYNQLSGWMYYQAIGALILLPCILRSQLLRTLLDASVSQWLGKISFSFYLIHGPVLHSLGFWVMPRLFEQLGWLPGLAVGYVFLLSIALYLANWFHNRVDVWSMTVGRRIERNLLE